MDERHQIPRGVRPGDLMGINLDSDRIVPAEEWSRVSRYLRQIDPHMSAVTLGPGGTPISTVVPLPVGIYKFNLFGLLPVAFRITAQQDGEGWFNRREGEVIRFFQEPIIRAVNPGEVLLWRQIFDFEPWSELNIIRVARPSTYGG